MERRVVLILLFSLFLLSVSSLYPQRVSIELRLYTERPQSYRYSLEAGIHNEATVCLDTALGEEEIPLFPPEGFFPVFYLPCRDSITGVPIMTQEDFRPVPEDFLEPVVYNIQMQRDGYPLHIEWDMLPMEVDSAWLEDPFAVYRFPLHQQSSAVIDNNAVRELSLQIWYNQRLTALSEGAASRSFYYTYVITSGNPAISLEREYIDAHVQIFDLYGRLLTHFPFTGSVLQFPQFPSGMYFLRVSQQNFRVIVY